MRPAAEDGYLAIAPDLFWRLEPGIELDPDIEPEMQRALTLMGKFDQDSGIHDIEATIKHVRTKLPDGAKVGAVGYCLGGRLAFMTATRTDIDASVGYYGVGIDNLLREQSAIAHPCFFTFLRMITSSTRQVSRRCTKGWTIIPRLCCTIIPAKITALQPNSGADDQTRQQIWRTIVLQNSSATISCNKIGDGDTRSIDAPRPDSRY